MGPCSSTQNDKASIIDHPSNRRLSDASTIDHPSNSRRVSEASAGDDKSNRTHPQVSTTTRRRSSVSFREPVVSSTLEYQENGSKNIGYGVAISDNKVNSEYRADPREANLNAPVYRTEQPVDSIVTYQNRGFPISKEIIVDGDDFYNNSKILTEPGDVNISYPINQLEPTLDTTVRSQKYDFRSEPVIIQSSALPYSGYQMDDIGVVMNTSGESVVAELQGKRVYDPAIGEMVYVLDESAPVDGLERSRTTEINSRPSIVISDFISPRVEPLQVV